MNIATQKKELIRWISSVDDQNVLDKLNSLKKKEALDFEKQLKSAISSEELKKRTTNFLTNLNWKK